MILKRAGNKLAQKNAGGSCFVLLFVVKMFMINPPFNFNLNSLKSNSDKQLEQD